MIEKRTVFILGAGASCPYGFPTARRLRKEILSTFEDRYMQFLGGAGEEVGALRKANGYPDLRIAKQFLERFELSGVESIDLFLSRNPAFETIGKMAICLSILHAERESKFREEVEKPEHDWYFYLYSRLTQEATRPDDYHRFGDNLISFITFNYDRSLEYYLFNCLLYSFEGMDRQRTDEELQRRPIIHVYGRPTLPKSAESGKEQTLAYGKEMRGSLASIDLLSVIGSIHVVHEERTNPELEKARTAISEAERIFFLGFGYAKENLEVLGFPDVVKRNHRIFGTAMGATEKERRDRENDFVRALQRSGSTSAQVGDQVKIRACDCVALLREFF